MTDLWPLPAPFTWRPSVTAQDFYGRERELSALFDLLRRGQSVTLIGLPRLGKTSLLGRLAQNDMRRELGPGVAAVELLDCATLGAHRPLQPLDFYRGVAQLIQARQDMPVAFDWEDVWELSDQLFNIIARSTGWWVLMLDNFQALEGMDRLFFDRLRSRASHSQLVLVQATPVSLDRLDIPSSPEGSPFDLFTKSFHLGAWTPTEFDAFLRAMSDRTGDNLMRYRATIQRLTGRLPFLVQHTSARFYETLRHGSIDLSALETSLQQEVTGELDRLWTHLTDREKETLHLILDRGVAPSSGLLARAVLSLQRSGLVDSDGQIGAQFLADYVDQQKARI